MKTWYNILIVCFAALLYASCEKDETRMVAKTADTATPPSLTIEYPNTLHVTNPNDETYTAILNWTKADFGKDIVVEYMLEISCRGEISSAMDTIALGSSLYSRTLKTSELNQWATEIGQLSTSEEIYLDMRIVASVALANSAVIDYPDKVYSNAVTVQIYPYVDDNIVYSTTNNLYMIGEEFGGWSWESPDLVTMIPVTNTSDEFWCIRYMTAGKGFKWNTVKNWDDGTDFYMLNSWVGTTYDNIQIGGGNLEMKQSGLYLIYVNMNNSYRRILIEPALVYGIGPAFEGGEIYDDPRKESNLFTVKGTAMVYNGLPYEGRLRMSAHSQNIDTATGNKEWWQREFTIIDGRIAYRANFGEMTNYGQPAAGDDVLLKFNTRQGIFATPQQ